jgi:hypothetical protein
MKSLLVIPRVVAHQVTYIHLRVAAKENTVGVGQEHTPIGLQLPHDAGHLITHDPIQHHAAAAGLHELHPIAGADGKALPVDDGAVALLLHQQRVGAWGADAGLAGLHHTARGQGRLGHRGGQRCECACQHDKSGSHSRSRARPLLPLRGSGFGHGYPHAPLFAENQTKQIAIHGYFLWGCKDEKGLTRSCSG